LHGRIALIGDHSDAIVAHRAIPIALELSVKALDADVSWDWLHSSTLEEPIADRLEPYAGVWCVPGSPYQNTAGVIAAVHFARTQTRPFLGTCGGFQHAVIEYARALWGIEGSHAELDPAARDAVIAPLVCALVDVSGGLRFEPNSRLATIYGRDSANEEYHCSYGFNPLYESRLNTGALRVAARDDDGGVRAVELDGHPFFIATLFQPERAALRGRVPPLVKAFVAAVAMRTQASTFSPPSSNVGGRRQ
jgi:CTP synthase (UTP-ammonia lyase)